MPIIVRGRNEVFIEESSILVVIIRELIFVDKAVVPLRIVWHGDKDNIYDGVKVI